MTTTLPTVLGKVVMVEGCTVLPSITALHAVPADGCRLDEITVALEQARRYRESLLDLRAETILELKEKGWKLRKIARKLGLRYIASVNQMVDQRRHARRIDMDRAAG